MDWTPPDNLLTHYLYDLGDPAPSDLTIDFPVSNGNCTFESTFTGPADTDTNRWGFVPTNPITFTYTPEDLTIDSNMPKLYSSLNSDAQFVFNAGGENGIADMELEGNWTFTYEVTGVSGVATIADETFTHTFTLEIIDNPCVPDMDYTEDDAVYTFDQKIKDREHHEVIEYASNGNCRYLLEIFDVDCSSPYDRTGNALDPAISFT